MKTFKKFFVLAIIIFFVNTGADAQRTAYLRNAGVSAENHNGSGTQYAINLNKVKAGRDIVINVGGPGGGHCNPKPVVPPQPTTKKVCPQIIQTVPPTTTYVCDSVWTTQKVFVKWNIVCACQSVNPPYNCCKWDTVAQYQDVPVKVANGNCRTSSTGGYHVWSDKDKNGRNVVTAYGQNRRACYNVPVNGYNGGVNRTITPQYNNQPTAGNYHPQNNGSHVTVNGQTVQPNANGSYYYNNNRGNANTNQYSSRQRNYAPNNTAVNSNVPNSAGVYGY